MRRPDFFVVGAPKCGTTAIAQLFRQHPEIAMSSVKEPHFFGSDLNREPRVGSQEEYLALFAQARDEKRVGEASVWYLYSERAAEEIAQFSPGARIMAVLRNPVDMIYSLHSQAVYEGGEDILDFEEALAADADRVRGRRLPRYRQAFVSYRGAASYADQIERYLDVFGQEAVHVGLYEDFKDDPLRWYRQACTFLDVNEAFAPRIEVVNANKKARSDAIRGFIYQPPGAIGRLIRTFTTQGIRREVAAGIRRLNTRYAPRDPMPLDLRRQLTAHFAPEVQRLAELLDRDLSGWLEAS